MTHEQDGYHFTSESVTEGHPDKVADQISDAILDAALAEYPASRVAVETLLTTGLVVIAGEITTDAHIDYADIARATICGIGYDSGELGYDGNAVGVMTALDRQSPDIAQGVDRSRTRPVAALSPRSERGRRGDQGMMFGYATNETPQTDARADRARAPAGPAPGRGAQVRNPALPAARRQDPGHRALRRGGRPVAVEKVLISAQHADSTEDKLPDALWTEVVTAVLPEDLYDPARLRHDFLRQPDRAVRGGRPVRRHRADRPQDHRRHLRRVGPYTAAARCPARTPPRWTGPRPTGARYVAKNIVAAGLADRAELQVAYAIGMARPLSMHIDTFGTEKIPRPAILDLVRENFDLRPAALHDHLQAPHHLPGHRRLRPLRPRRARLHLGAHRQSPPPPRTSRPDALRRRDQLAPPAALEPRPEN